MPQAKKLIESAQRYSPYLHNLINSKQISITQLSSLLNKPLSCDFFHHFTNWDEIENALNEHQLKYHLSLLRCLTFAQVMIRDLNHLSSLEEVMLTMSHLADFCLIKAQRLTEKLYTQRYGEPIGTESQNIQHLTIIAMGKLGGQELNVSSDIDLIFTYPEEGRSSGRRQISLQEFFTKTTQKIIQLIDSTTENGRIFRVDNRLRPYGDSGPIVMSEEALENYLLTQGRDWERYAWIKARVVSPYPNRIKKLIIPFVYRKYLDFNSLESMRQLYRQVAREISYAQTQDNIKLGYGGIREIEFIAQIFQLIRGGQFSQLQSNNIKTTLMNAAQLNIINESQAKQLLSSYAFLRQTEHRLQYRHDQQTHSLPQHKEEQQLLASSMNFADYHLFINKLNQHRQNVNALFKGIFHLDTDQENEDKISLDTFWQRIDDQHYAKQILQDYSIANQDSVLRQLQQFRHNCYSKTNPRVQNLFDQLIPKYLKALADSPPQDITLSRLLDLSKQLIGRPSYLAFLNEYPAVIHKLIGILNQSEWMANYLSRYPILLDELIGAQLLDTHFDWQGLKHHLTYELKKTGSDVEAQMDLMRQVQHSFIFRLAMQELHQLWRVEDLSDQLAFLADILLEISLYQVWQNYQKTHSKLPKFGIIAYGKLGGKELTYTSDLDLVYLYDDDNEKAGEIYSWFATRLTSFLSAATANGRLYKIDLRLRPYGEAGFLVSEMNFFQRYQKKQAWTWEHQALSRARFIAGDKKIAQAFYQLRKEILLLPRNHTKLKKDIINMRERIASSHSHSLLDVKYARGGLTDVEFIIQYIVLAYSTSYPALTDNIGNIALLKRAADYSIIDQSLAQAVGDAYRAYRKIAHNQVLHDHPPPVDQTQLLQHYATVRELWQQVFKNEGQR